MRLMLLASSNSYRDREGEIVRNEALKDYVTRAWRNGAFEDVQPLLFWHDGEPIGEIVYADMEGPFLIEVARELPGSANLAADGDPPLVLPIAEVWDVLAEMQDELGASIGGRGLVDGEGDYGIIVEKYETSVLPRRAAANEYTFIEITGGNHEPQESA